MYKNAKVQRSFIGKLGGFNIGMSCIIQTYNGLYIAFSLLPLTTNSLCYGSNTAGIHIARNDKEIDLILPSLMNKLNYKKHLVTQLYNNEQVEMLLPYNVEVHKYYNKECQKLFFINRPWNLFIKVPNSCHLRTEALSTYTVTESSSVFEKFTWKCLVKCTECDNWIKDYDFYAHQSYRAGYNKSQYMCCLTCYNHLSPSKGFRIPFNQIIAVTLPEPLRFTYWRNARTGEIVYESPDVKMAYNPDAFSSENEKDKKALTSLLAKVKKDIVINLINELDNNKVLIDAEHLAEVAHAKGINIRFLGKLVFMPKSNYIREIAVILILSRSIKYFILKELENSKDSKNIIITYLNQLLSLADNEGSKEKWTLLAEYVRSHWGIIIDKSVLRRVNMTSLMIAVCNQLHVDYNESFNINYLSPTPFNTSKLIINPSIIDTPPKSQTINFLLRKIQELMRESKSGRRDSDVKKLVSETIRLTVRIYEKDAESYADVYLDCAIHLMSLHEGYIEWEWGDFTSSKDKSNITCLLEEALKIYEEKKPSSTKQIKCLLALAQLTTDVIISSIIEK